MTKPTVAGGNCATVESIFVLNRDLDGSIKLRMCGPTPYQVTFDREIVFRPNQPHHGNITTRNRRTRVSGSILCSLTEWEEGDYVDDADLNSLSSV